MPHALCHDRVAVMWCRQIIGTNRRRLGVCVTDDLVREDPVRVNNNNHLCVCTAAPKGVSALHVSARAAAPGEVTGGRENVKVPQRRAKRRAEWPCNTVADCGPLTLLGSLCPCTSSGSLRHLFCIALPPLPPRLHLVSAPQLTPPLSSAARGCMAVCPEGGYIAATAVRSVVARLSNTGGGGRLSHHFFFLQSPKFLQTPKRDRPSDSRERMSNRGSSGERDHQWLVTAIQRA